MARMRSATGVRNDTPRRQKSQSLPADDQVDQFHVLVRIYELEVSTDAQRI